VADKFQADAIDMPLTHEPMLVADMPSAVRLILVADGYPTDVNSNWTNIVIEKSSVEEWMFVHNTGPSPMIRSKLLH
jgi:hypothetical protein